MKQNYKYIIFVLLLSLLYSCKESTVKKYSGSFKNIKYHTLTLDTVIVNIENTSFIGFSGINNNHLYFYDKFFGYYYSIGTDGKSTEKIMGKGRGPNELPIKNPLGIDVADNNFLALGSSYDAYFFKNFKDREFIPIKVSHQENSYEDTRIYSYMPDLIIKRYNNKFYINVYSERATMNPIIRSKDYFQNAHFLMEVDIKNGETNVFGNYSEHYIKNPNKLNHWFGALYDIDPKGNFHVSFQADSLIYVYDNKSKLSRTYGFKGKEMDTNYKQISGSWESVFSKYEYDTKHRGYYYWIKYIPELHLTFRSYQKSSDVEYDGLQIYKEDVLVGDINVPKKFKVAGYIAPYFVTQVEDRYENETLQFYRFVLK